MTSSLVPSSRSFALSENNGSPSRSDANSDIVFSGAVLGAAAPGLTVFVGASCSAADAESGPTTASVSAEGLATRACCPVAVGEVRRGKAW